MSQAESIPFQSLETFSAIFPIIGNFSRHFSNHWKLFPPFFQPLETFPIRSEFLTSTIGRSMIFFIDSPVIVVIVQFHLMLKSTCVWKMKRTNAHAFTSTP
ncbi:MAG: hypothetical protein EOM20_09590 [Spartobacteria bacterium]|nr:hypothetical protein [Spartobacteria bacterium]